MLQNLVSYLLGSAGVSETATVPYEASTLVVSRLEDDWMLVDCNNSGDKLEADLVESLYVNPSATICDVDRKSTELALETIPTMLTRTNSASSLPNSTSMDESWFVTPPPCFTSTGPIHMETSPLEDLLIEHPSMSVYRNNPRVRSYSGGERQQQDSSVASESALVPKQTTQTASGNAVHSRELVTHSRFNKIREQQERQIVKAKQAQKAQIHMACQIIKRNCLERSNKARDVNSRNQRQRRGERSQGAKRSFANNNRKC